MQLAKHLLWMIALIPAAVFGQNVRWDLPIYTTQAQGGNLLPVYAIPGALVSFYSEPSGLLANTYNSATSVVACPTGAQVVLQNSSACVGSADPFGNMGSWFLPGQYMATIKSPFKTYNYSFTIGGGLPGSVSSVSVVTANGFTGTVATPTTTPAISISVDSTHFLPTNTGLATTFLSGAATYLPPFTLGTTGTSGPATFTAGVLNIPQYATVYPGFGIANSTGSAWGTSYLPQGTDPKLLSSGTISGTPGSSLCTDANLGATTSSCSGGGLGGTLTPANVTFGTGAGTGPSLTSITGVDGNFNIHFVTGATPGSGTIFTVTFTAPRSEGACVSSPSTYVPYATFTQLPGVNVISTTSTFMTSGASPLTASTGYAFNFVCP